MKNLLKWSKPMMVMVMLLIITVSFGACSKVEDTKAPGNTASNDLQANTNADTSQSPVLTMETYDKIKLGMTLEEVKSITVQDGQKTTLGTDHDQYGWYEQQKSLTVDIEKGKVTQKAQTYLGRKDSNVTLELFNKITKGMTFDEVKGILGNECQELTQRDSLGKIRSSVAWMKSDLKSVTVQFEDNKVIDTTNLGVK